VSTDPRIRGGRNHLVVCGDDSLASFTPRCGPRSSTPTCGGAAVDWSPRPGDELQPGDRLVVLATRAGLSRVLARGRPQ